MVRPMAADDLGQVAMLEQTCFPDPWSIQSLAYDLLANPQAVYYTAVRGNLVAGYTGLHHILDEGHIMNLAVSHAERRRGVGRCLLSALVAYAWENSLGFLTLEVRVSNGAALALYESFGFKREGLRTSYYKKPLEDAIIMTLKTAVDS